jgi:hypothetical protein
MGTYSCQRNSVPSFSEATSTDQYLHFCAEDQMIILGTDGLWELGNQEVVDICLAAG